MNMFHGAQLQRGLHIFIHRETLPTQVCWLWEKAAARSYEPLWQGLLLWDRSAKQTLEQCTNQNVQQPQEAISAEYDEQADHQTGQTNDEGLLVEATGLFTRGFCFSMLTKIVIWNCYRHTSDFIWVDCKTITTSKELWLLYEADCVQLMKNLEANFVYAI